MSDQQRPLGDDEVCQPEQAEQLSLVLGKAFVAGLLVTEQVLDHMERVLDLGGCSPFVKTNKNDRNDAEAIVEAASRPAMRSFR